MAADNIKSTKLAADGEITGGPAYLRGFVYRTTAAAGSAVAFKDDGAAGTILLDVDTDAVVTVREVRLPGRGVLFRTDIYADVGSCDSVTAFYEEA